MTAPQNTPEERAKALEAALEARHARSVLKRQVTNGELSLQELFDRGHRGATDELGEHARVAGRIEVGDALLAVTGIGPVKGAAILAEADVEEGTRLDQLSHDDVEAIVAAVDELGYGSS